VKKKVGLQWLTWRRRGLTIEVQQWHDSHGGMMVAKGSDRGLGLGAFYLGIFFNSERFHSFSKICQKFILFDKMFIHG